MKDTIARNMVVEIEKAEINLKYAKQDLILGNISKADVLVRSAIWILENATKD